jgi:S1-C subfamily serine protease
VRPKAVFALSLVSAAAGAAAVLLLAGAAGWVGSRGTETVVVGDLGIRDSEPDPEPQTAARPLAGNGFDPASIYEARSAGVVTVYAVLEDHEDAGDAAQGSGFVVSEEGYVLTNSHVITDAREGKRASDVRAAETAYVEFSDGDRVEASIVGFDLFDDVGLLRVDPGEHRLEPVPLGDSAGVVVGEPVAAIGSPFGEQSSLAVGVVAATRRAIEALTSNYRLIDAIQTDAPINRGNSGGPLFDARGRVIGINAQIRSRTGFAEGVGFAVPINAAKRSMAQLIERGKVSYAYIGISTSDLTPRLARELGYAERRGALVVAVSADGPGDDAGLRAGTRTLELGGRDYTVGGDVILAVDRIEVGSSDALVRIITSDLEAGRTAVFTVLREGRRLHIPIKLGQRPLDAPRQ